MSEKIKQPSQSAVLFWGGLALGPVGAILALIAPSAPWTGILVTVAGAALAGRQRIIDNRAHRQEVKSLEARDTKAEELRMLENLSKGRETMPPTGEREGEARA